MSNQRPDSAPLYLTGDHPCAYLPGRTARTLFLDPRAPMSPNLYGRMLAMAFRRSGVHVYRPACPGCHACVPVRIPVEEFTPDRSQRRNWERNGKDLTVRERPARFDPVHFDLYRAYLQHRHAESSMADATAESYEDFLLRPWGGDTVLLELRLADRLMGVAVTDRVERALSAVYTFFDPRLADRAPGTTAILCQIRRARELGLDWVYLGYWIEDCRKMRYKDRFRPVEALVDGTWRHFGRGDPIDWR